MYLLYDMLHYCKNWLTVYVYVYVYVLKKVQYSHHVYIHAVQPQNVLGL